MKKIALEYVRKPYFIILQKIEEKLGFEKMVEVEK